MSRQGSNPEEEAKEEAPQSSPPSAPTLHAAFSSLKKEAIGAHTGLRNYERGLEYWRAGRVRDRRAEGETISARCTGNSPAPYRIRASVVGGNRLRASCTCPVGSGGTCKHVAAVLVACALEPDTFVPAHSIRDRLDSLSKDQIVHLFLTVLEHNPELDWVLETVGEGTQSGDDEALFDRFYSMAVAAVPNDMAWGATASTAQQLCDILAIADEFVDSGNSAGAAAVFHGVLQATLEAYHFLHDEGEISWVLVNSAKGIAACLPAFEPASARRKGLLDGLTGLMKLDVEMGGFGLADDLPDLLATFATPDERGRIAAWLRRQMEAQNGDDHSASYRRRHFSGLLIDIEKADMNDEDFIRVCREGGRYGDLVERLHSLGRRDEAVEVAAGVDSDYTLLEMKTAFAEHGAISDFEALLAARADDTADPRVWEWLRDHYHETGRHKQALDMARRVFSTRPNVPKYRAVRDIATTLGTWAAVRKQLLDQLRESEDFPELIDIHLEENDIPAAIEVLDLKPERRKFGWRFKQAEVARAAEADYPMQAVELHRREVRSLLSHRGRNVYRRACEHLTAIRCLLREAGRDDDWKGILEAVQIQVNRLPACKDEMRKAGLI